MTDHQTLTQLDASAAFSARHIGPRADQRQRMLSLVGFDSLDALMAAAVPEGIQTGNAADQGDRLLPLGEGEALSALRQRLGSNRPGVAMIGLGYHPTATPAVVRRGVLEDPSWYTAYTPYQPEISQGRLEALLNFQTMVGDLTGLPTANASLLDEATAAAEAMTLVRRGLRGAAAAAPFVVDADCLPQTLAVVHTRARSMRIEVVEADLADGLPDGELSGVLIAYPGASGQVRDPRPLIDAAHERGGQAVVVTDPLALCLLESPGELGADVVIGSAQRFGVPMWYGGPHAGFMAVRDGLARHLPGRLVGVSVDAEGRAAYRLALQTREQHIRRDKATSNICTAQVLLAVAASMYAVYHGPDGLRAIAQRVHRFAVVLAAGLRAGGVEVVGVSFVDTVVARVPGAADEVVAAARADGIHLRRVDADHVGVSTNELTTRTHLRQVWSAFGLAATDGDDLAGDRAGDRADDRARKKVGDINELDLATADALPEALRRRTPYLTHPVFSRYHSETAMLRYLRRLAARDYALDRGMIPLGSCTMKLNATTEMKPLGWSEIAELHPFVPAVDARGILDLAHELEGWLADLTGYAAVSLQPNAGSQGELAGLMAIRAYHVEAGQGERDVCLIPSSAHGTNAASAVMAGLRVVVVAASADGSVDLGDLRAKCDEHRDDLAAVMVTYPSTHGVYEAGITELCDVAHAHGGQVYVDGANLNALLGHAEPGRFGGDVSHLNLHKTFCIPHGGGGPGVGPVAVAAHLAPYLPSHPMHPDPERRAGVGPVSAAPYGSAGILAIPWLYIQLMGTAGLTEATGVAVLAANYVARRLRDHVPVLYAGAHDLVAHECILDFRPLTKRTGVTVDDVAKRLVDHGFHAPTMSFPVPGTLMVEPTESEDLLELDRFCDAMVAITAEIEQVAQGVWSVEDSPLRHAPHTAAAVTGQWGRAYSREQGALTATGGQDKYWPPVARVDQAYGDRNLVCACPPIDAFA
ncbi:MAG: aminomethyl-transferring glycine dehydrogenase [Nocardioidaceae bacterium]|nr:aminomethyl-transferring glycine dehydrogenase [Nocardioidaceae bacterium]